MPTYNYDQFRKAAQDSGLLGEFSQADLTLAQRNPDAGMSILKYKQDYHNATTDEARALANLGAETVRGSYGGYTGGNTGGSFHLNPLSPSSFQSGGYENRYAQDMAELWDRQKNYGSSQPAEPAPEYDSRYDAVIQQQIAELLNREDFAYNPDTDPLYQNYRKQYAREGQRATADALGAAAAASGGIASSYANTAANQAANYYAAQMTDRIPELEQLAYDRYLNDYQMALSDLGVVQGQEQTDYDRYLNELAQYNTDRSFDYNAWLDRYNMAKDQLQTAQGMEQLDYQKYLNDRNFNYGVLLDEIDSQTREREEALNLALIGAENNDYRLLEEWGIDASNNPAAQEQRAQQQALAQAQVDAMLQAGGTPSADLIAASGYADEYVQEMRDYYRQTAGGGSGAWGGSSGGSGSSAGAGSAGSGSAGTGSAYERMYQSGVRSEADAYDWAVANGYSSTEAGNLAMYFTDDYLTAKKEQEEQARETAGMDFGSFRELIQMVDRAAGTDAEGALAGELDRVWGALTTDQRQQLRTVLRQHNLSYLP